MTILNGISGAIRFSVGCGHCRSNVSPSDKYCRQCGKQLVEMPVGETQNGEWILYPKDIKELLKKIGEIKGRQALGDPAKKGADDERLAN